jgi:hypothetical protein
VCVCWKTAAAAWIGSACSRVNARSVCRRERDVMSTGRRINEDKRGCKVPRRALEEIDLDLNTAFDIQQRNSWVRQ